TPRDPIRSTTVETCLACRGYLKTVTTLGPTPADELGLLDLATVDLDVAAIGSGYSRPVGPGAPLGARVRARTGGLLSGWRCRVRPPAPGSSASAGPARAWRGGRCPDRPARRWRARP